MSVVLLCNGTLSYSSGTPQCTEWIEVQADIIITPQENYSPDPQQLILAAGAGVVVGLPLAMALFGVKMAKKILMKS